jgi:hypothetical protein
MPVESLIEAYAAGLQEARNGATEVLVLRILQLRDAIVRTVAGEALTEEETSRLLTLDEECRRLAPQFAAEGGELWNRWRESLATEPRGWWWFPDQRARGVETPSLFVTIVVGTGVAASLALTADVARRFLTGDYDLAGIFGTVVQAMFTVLAGAAFTSAGREVLVSRLRRSRIPPTSWGLVRAGIAAMCFALVTMFWLGLPRIARRYEKRGIDAKNQSRYSLAKRHLERAVALAPESPRAHHELGATYESLYRNEEAIRSYQQAFALDSNHVLAASNLARLELLSGKNPARALDAITSAMQSLSRRPEKPAADLQAVLFKNRAWAYLELGFLTLADADLQTSIQLAPDLPDGHCLRLLADSARCRSTEELRPSALRCIALGESSTKTEVIVWRNHAKEFIDGGRMVADALTATKPCVEPGAGSRIGDPFASPSSGNRR